MKEKYWLEAQSEYVKRLSRFAKVEIVELKDEPTMEDPTEAQRQMVLKKEAERVKKAMEGFDVTSVLAIEAKEEDSLQFAAHMGRHWNAGKSICFIIGGSFGLADEIKAAATEKFSLSRLTFPHRLARIVLLEQLFRAFKICAGEDYHK
ncbi:MAG: 23S rRNA (pseudouridine(1915)-N(3))-methyltransferase RlmH [Christensenellaceae bacterium]|nr:23S rRNA (pseudouridine(1915)-N(3))-methyltransferase RlmH [Christensenellaceae bacterium]